MNAIKEAWLYEAIGKKVKSIRQLKHLNQQELASKAKLSRTSLVNIEQGNQHVSLHHLWRIAESLEVELHSLLPTSSEISEARKNITPSIERKTKSDDEVHSFIELSHKQTQPKQ